VSPRSLHVAAGTVQEPEKQLKAERPPADGTTA
jgi:hypothetical protein